MINAGNFASTPSGWVAGLLIPAILAIAGYFWRRQETRRSAEAKAMRDKIDKIESALTVNTQALALLVQQNTSDRPTLDKVNTLDKAVAVLEDRMNRHEEWANAENSRLRGKAST